MPVHGAESVAASMKRLARPHILQLQKECARAKIYLGGCYNLEEFRENMNEICTTIRDILENLDVTLKFVHNNGDLFTAESASEYLYLQLCLIYARTLGVFAILVNGITKECTAEETRVNLKAELAPTEDDPSLTVTCQQFLEREAD